MNKKFINALLFSAALLSTGMVSSCKDYDDDIDALDNRVTAVETTVADLQKKIAEGKWITKFERNSSNNGYILTLSDSSTLEIKDGEKGANGTSGTNGKNGTEWKIDSEGYWVYKADGDTDFKRTDPAVKAEGENGLPGATGEAGKAPEIDPDTKEWITYQWNSETKQWDEVKTGVSAVGTSSYVIEFDLYYELHMATATVVDGETVMSKDFTVIKLPRTNGITSLELYTLDGSKLSDPDLTIKTGVCANAISFNGRNYAKGEVLTAMLPNKLVAQINPLDVDATKYSFKLQDSQGNTPYSVEAVEEVKTTSPLTRATDEEKVNKGFWYLQVTLNANQEDIENKDAIYALVTTDVNGNSISTGFTTKVTNEQVSTSISPISANPSLDINKTYALNDLVSNADKMTIVDYKLSVPTSETANADKLGLQISEDNRSFFATGTGQITLNVEYLDMTGVKSSKPVSVTCTFKSTSEVTGLGDFTWTIDNYSDSKKNTVKVSASSIAEYLDKLANGGTSLTAKTTKTGNLYYIASFVNGSITVNNNEIKDVPADALPEITFKKEDIMVNSQPTGYKEWNAYMTFDYTKVYDADYTATLTIINGNETKTVDFKISTKLADAERVFKYTRNAGYFSGDNATAFPSANSFVNDNGVLKSTYSLNALYKDLADGNNVADKPQVSYKEDVPSSKGKNWLDDTDETKSLISVPDASDKVNGAYTTRKITLSHYPLNSKRFNKVSDVIYVTVKSSIFENGVIEYLGSYDKDKETYLKETREIKSGATVEYDLSGEFKAIDYHENEYQFVTVGAEAADARISSVSVVPSDEIKDYVEVTYTSGNQKATVARKSATSGLVNDLNGNIIVSVKDKFGKTVSVNVPVIVKK